MIPGRGGLSADRGGAADGGAAGEDLAAEVETAAPLAASWRRASRARLITSLPSWTASQQDGLPQYVRTGEAAARRLPGRLARRCGGAMKLAAERNRVIVEGASACAMRRRSADAPGRGSVAIVSGGTSTWRSFRNSPPRSVNILMKACAGAVPVSFGDRVSPRTPIASCVQSTGFRCATIAATCYQPGAGRLRNTEDGVPQRSASSRTAPMCR